MTVQGSATNEKKDFSFRDRVLAYPPVMLIKIEVIQNLKKSKLPVLIPQELRLADLMHAAVEDNKLYKLKAVVCHQGDSLDVGHYICYSLRKYKKKV